MHAREVNCLCTMSQIMILDYRNDLLMAPEHSEFKMRMVGMKEKTKIEVRSMRDNETIQWSSSYPF